MEYNDSKQVGNIGEYEILRKIHKKYPRAYIDDTGKANSDWDIYVPETKAGIEVKMDYESFYTGNLVVEVEMFGRPSALSKTKAKYWVFITGIRYIWITPLELYRFIELQRYMRAAFTGNGDEVEKQAYLIKHDDFIKYIYNNLDKKDGWVEMIDEKELLHRNKFLKQKPQ